MLEIEIDGHKVEVPDGSMVMEAVNKAGTYVPHFCYHKKLSIAANCRMCLVQVEKAPKPLPACATPVTNGMKVWTRSEQAVKAQQGVMEFLLINHPLDCPICDQGGECQLQDIAVGYGGSTSRYSEEKRVVVNKNLGPLIATDMTRCIHCTRCVRFGQEIAGVMELGVANRGEYSEIMTFVGQTVDSELSGNMIDLCPVGALTSKPFRFSARTWELARRKSISPHDSLGSNLVVQVKANEVKRVLPMENEAVNECWISDRDRFSYEALASDARLLHPAIKRNGMWTSVSWQVALEHTANALIDVAKQDGGDQVAALLSPHSTLEEMFLSQRLLRGLGSDNVDFRLRQIDFSLDGRRLGVPWLGMKVTELTEMDAVLVVGSFLRKDHPLLAQRLRQAARRGCAISRLHVCADDWLVSLSIDWCTRPSALPVALAEIVLAAAKLSGKSIPDTCTQACRAVEPSTAAVSLAESLLSKNRKAILLGNYVLEHPQSSVIQILVQGLADLTGARHGVIGAAANSVGGYVARALPAQVGHNVVNMITQPRRAYMLFGIDPDLDFADGVQALKSLDSADTVVAVTSFTSPALQRCADVLLPLAPFTETSGSFINAEGLLQSFDAVASTRGEARPGWKILRVLGNLLSMPGFTQASSEEVLSEILGGEPVGSVLSNRIDDRFVAPPVQVGAGLERIADVPIYSADPLVRRAPSLQKTVDARPPTARMAASTLSAFGVVAGEVIKLQSQQGTVSLLAEADDAVPSGCIRVACAHPTTVALGAAFQELKVEPV